MQGSGERGRVLSSLRGRHVQRGAVKEEDGTLSSVKLIVNLCCTLVPLLLWSEHDEVSGPHVSAAQITL